MRPQLRFSTRLACANQASKVLNVWAQTWTRYQPQRIHTSGNEERNPVYSEEEDIERISGEVASLIHKTDRGWAISENGKGLERSFKFKSFKTTWGFMNVIAKQCAVQRHHPEWSNVRFRHWG
ncbi:hypothetical protein FGG08_004025 [Glutinoglossum americanum]|uniref:4a-hydroxytetrahydrobiopterin dehydratase n=1 Tax=Glutinoglossum americanum TaxID=1670608 RepID=A0A9P8I8D2_9PEZI|nr:hypothetical protein FGG08_004025 [Glutinoglossum americanum]